MRYLQLPESAKRLSCVGLGIREQETEESIHRMLHAFRERGGAVVDTAWSYGKGFHDRAIGQWLRHSGNRDAMFVIAKGGGKPCTPETAVRHLSESLDRLGIEQVDLFMLHRDNPDVSAGEFIDALDEARRAGMATLIGASNWTIDRFEEANRHARRCDRSPFSVLSNQFSLAQWIDVPWPGCRTAGDERSAAWLRESRTPLVAWSSQARGFFSRATQGLASDQDLVRCWFSPDNFARLERAGQVASRHSISTSAVALAYVLEQPFPVVALIGPRDPSELDSSLDALRLQLDADSLAWLATGVGNAANSLGVLR